MKVCLLTDAWTPVWGGGQSHVWEIAKRLVLDYSCRVDIVVPNLTDKTGRTFPTLESYFEGRLQLRRLGAPFVFPGIFGRGRFILAAAKYVATTKYDVYHSHSYSTGFLVWPVKILRRGKFLFTLHGVGKNLLGGGVLNSLGLSRLSGAVIYLFPYDGRMTAAASSLAPKYRRDFVTAGNGVDIAEFDAGKGVPNKNFFTVLCISRPDPVKGIEILEKAVALVRKKSKRLRLRLVSGRPRTARDFNGSDLYVLPSLSEGLPIVLLEAMAAGLPVVATDVGDCRKIVEEARAGVIVPPGDPEALAKAIRAMIISKKRRQMGENGYNFVRRHYTWDKVAATVFREYEKALS